MLPHHANKRLRACGTGHARWWGLVSVCLVVLAISACTIGTTPGPTASTPTPASAPFTVTSVDLLVTPTSIAGTTCGSTASFSYTAIFHLPAHNAGGTIHFAYTLNNGRSQQDGTVTASADAISATFTFTSVGTLAADHTYPGTAVVMVTSPNAIKSPPVKPSGACVESGASGPFQVTGVTMAVSPSSIAGTQCGTLLTVRYTAMFHLAANGPGGTVQFEYTINNGRGSTRASLVVAPGQTAAHYAFVWSGNLPADHTYPEPGGVLVTSPNALTSSRVWPSGTCS